jgi:hypothetical protein
MRLIQWDIARIYAIKIVIGHCHLKQTKGCRRPFLCQLFYLHCWLHFLPLLPLLSYPFMFQLSQILRPVHLVIPASPPGHLVNLSSLLVPPFTVESWEQWKIPISTVAICSATHPIHWVTSSCDTPHLVCGIFGYCSPTRTVNCYGRSLSSVMMNCCCMVPFR